LRIKLLSREITLIKVDENSKHLDTASTGKAKVYKNEIYFDGSDPFPVLLHEIAHMFLFNSGNDRRKDYTEEQICDMIGKIIEQLLLENGDDIIKQLKEFANEN